MSESCTSIEILKRVPFRGEGDSLEGRLREVTLRGFDDVKIYKSSLIYPKDFNSDEVRVQLHTPQPHVYMDKLERVKSLRNLFLGEGIDILRLDAAYDFKAVDDDGNETYWTMLPPIVERFKVPSLSESGGYDYRGLIGDRVRGVLDEMSLSLNSELLEMEVKSDNDLGEDIYRIINDGAHRVHLGVVSGEGIRVLEISGMTPGFAYYAAPQHYDRVQEIQTRDQVSAETKVHIVESPAHKHLYRLFPSGGIMSGDVRPDERLGN